GASTSLRRATRDGWSGGSWARRLFSASPSTLCRTSMPSLEPTLRGTCHSRSGGCFSRRASWQSDSVGTTRSCGRRGWSWRWRGRRRCCSTTSPIWKHSTASVPSLSWRSSRWEWRLRTTSRKTSRKNVEENRRGKSFTPLLDVFPRRLSLTPLDFRQCNPSLRLVLALLVLVAPLADVILVRLEEQHLRDALVGVDLGGQGSGVRNLERHVAFPLGLEGRDVRYDAAAGIGTLAHADGQNLAGYPEVLDGAGQGKGVRRDDADVPGILDE